MVLLLSVYQLVALFPTHLLAVYPFLVALVPTYTDLVPLRSPHEPRQSYPENQFVRQIQEYDLAELLMAEQMAKVLMLAGIFLYLSLDQAYQTPMEKLLMELLLHPE